jgi:hypothetical protein
MKRIGLLIGFLALLAFVLPSLTAQDEKKDAAKTDKKDEVKKDDRKDPEKKDETKKKAETKKEKFVHGMVHQAKILNVKADSNREFTIELPERDPAKVAEVQKWSAQRQVQLAQQYGQAASQKDFKARNTALQTWQRDSGTYQMEMAKKNIFTAKPFDVKAAETAKVRSNVPPVEFDDVGNEKKWTKKELDAKKDKTGWPGYFLVDFDALKPGQYVDVYMVKITPAKKGDPKKKKGPDDDDPPASAKDRPEFMLVVIRKDAGK